ncbi:MAG: DUF4124 domain-containing protein [Halothiobacillaceae bacterium]|nr:DUF4124 domain-containing protein [Halothiobacillaceae bacterium]HER34309.1 DUF4124 domain-containing protein [Halothiobacillaceae bacterium]
MPDVRKRTVHAPILALGLTLGQTLGLIALAGAMISPAQATKVYQYTNSAGETVFTDEPVAGAKVHEVESPPVIPLEPVEVPEPTTTDQPARSDEPAPAPTPAEAGATPTDGAPSEAGPRDYQVLEITEPVDGEVASRPHNSITIELAIQPALQRDDRVFILVDGQERVKDSTGRRHLINGLAPGRHELVAQLRREGEVVIESAPVNFQLVSNAQ